MIDLYENWLMELLKRIWEIEGIELIGINCLGKSNQFQIIKASRH
jgi:hypothetical protein